MNNNNPTPTPGPSPSPTPSPSQPQSGQTPNKKKVVSHYPELKNEPVAMPTLPPTISEEDYYGIVDCYRINQYYLNNSGEGRIEYIINDDSSVTYKFIYPDGTVYESKDVNDFVKIVDNVVDNKCLREEYMLFDDEVAKYGDIVSRTNANGEKEYYLQYVVEEVVDGKLVKTIKEIPLGTDISKYSKDDIKKLLEGESENNDLVPSQQDYKYSDMSVYNGMYRENRNIAFKPCISIEDSDKYYQLIDQMKSQVVSKIDAINTSLESAASSLPEEDTADKSSIEAEKGKLEELKANADKLSSQIDICVSIYEYCDKNLKGFLDSYLLGKIFSDDFDKETWSAKLETDVGKMVDDIITELEKDIQDLYDNYLKDGIFFNEDTWKLLFGDQGELSVDRIKSRRDEIISKYGGGVYATLLQVANMNDITSSRLKQTCQYDADGNPIFGISVNADDAGIKNFYDTFMQYCDDFPELFSNEAKIAVADSVLGYTSLQLTYNGYKESLESAKNFKRQLPYLKYTTTDEYKSIRRKLLSGFAYDSSGKLIKIEYDLNHNIKNADEINKLLGLNSEGLNIKYMTPQEIAMSAYLGKNGIDRKKYIESLKNEQKKRIGREAAVNCMTLFLQNGIGPLDYLANSSWGSIKGLEDYVMGIAKLAAPGIGLTQSDYLKKYYTQLFADYAFQTIDDQKYVDNYAKYENGEISYNEYILRNSICNSIKSGKFSSFNFGCLGKAYELSYDITNTGTGLAVTAITSYFGVGLLGIGLNAASKAGTKAGEIYQSMYDETGDYGTSLGYAYAAGGIKFTYEFIKYAVINKILYGDKVYKLQRDNANGGWITKLIKEYDGLIKVPGGKGFVGDLIKTYFKMRVTDATMMPGTVLVDFAMDFFEDGKFDQTFLETVGEDLIDYTSEDVAIGMLQLISDLAEGKTYDEIISDAEKIGKARTNIIKVLWKKFLPSRK